VIDGGDLDINFYIEAPDGQILVSDVQKSDSAHKYVFNCFVLGGYLSNYFKNLF